MVGIAMVSAAAIGAGGSYLSSQQQAGAAQNGLGFQKRVYRAAQQSTSPYRDVGGDAARILASLTGATEGGNPLTSYLTRPFSMTQAQLEQTPGYQFTLDQGLKSVQNAYASQGLSKSGAAMKGAEEYATGLASNTFQQMFTDDLGQRQQIYNMLSGQAGLGENAAVQAGNTGAQIGSNIGNLYGALGSARAAGTNGIAGSLSSGANNYGSYLMMKELMGTPTKTASTEPGGNGLVGYDYGSA